MSLVIKDVLDVSPIESPHVDLVINNSHEPGLVSVVRKNDCQSLRVEI